jgi:hypothetical protein
MRREGLIEPFAAEDGQIRAREQGGLAELCGKRPPDLRRNRAKCFAGRGFPRDGVP